MHGEILFSSAMRIPFRTISAALLIVFAAPACASGSRAQRQQSGPASPSPLPASRLPLPDTTPAAADIRFLDGMIAHHAQALVMAGWASSHGASPSVQTLADRITNAQQDEIALMQRWLRDR